MMATTRTAGPTAVSLPRPPTLIPDTEGIYPLLLALEASCPDVLSLVTARLPAPTMRALHASCRIGHRLGRQVATHLNICTLPRTSLAQALSVFRCVTHLTLSLPDNPPDLPALLDSMPTLQHLALLSGTHATPALLPTLARLPALSSLSLDDLLPFTAQHPTDTPPAPITLPHLTRLLVMSAVSQPPASEPCFPAPGYDHTAITTAFFSHLHLPSLTHFLSPAVRLPLTTACALFAASPALGTICGVSHLSDSELLFASAAHPAALARALDSSCCYADGCGMTDAGLGAVAARLGPLLQGLRLKGSVDNAPAVTLAGMRALAAHCGGSLRALALSTQQPLPAEALRVVAGGLPRLRELILKTLEGLGSGELVALVGGCRELEWLELGGLQRVEAEGYEALGGLVRLQRVSLSRCEGLLGRTVERLVCGLPELEQLCLARAPKAFLHDNWPQLLEEWGRPEVSVMVW